MANRKKNGDCDLIELGEFESLMCCDRKRRQIMCEKQGIIIVSPCGQKMIKKQDMINMYTDCLAIDKKGPGKPRGFGDLQTVSTKQLKATKWKISQSKLMHLVNTENVRLFNFHGSKRVLMMDLKIVLNKQVKLNNN